eukprot:403334811
MLKQKIINVRSSVTKEELDNHNTKVNYHKKILMDYSPLKANKLDPLVYKQLAQKEIMLPDINDRNSQSIDFDGDNHMITTGNQPSDNENDTFTYNTLDQRDRLNKSVDVVQSNNNYYSSIQHKTQVTKKKTSFESNEIYEQQELKTTSENFREQYEHDWQLQYDENFQQSVYDWTQCLQQKYEFQYRKQKIHNDQR